MERAFKKLFLDAMVIQQGRLMEKNKSANKEELLEMIRFGADEVVRLGDVESPDFDIEEVRDVWWVGVCMCVRVLMFVHGSG